MRDTFLRIFSNRFSGILTGILLPIPFVYLVIAWKYPYLHWETFRQFLRVYAPAVQLGIIANLLPFSLFQYFDLIKAMQGVIIATLLFWGSVLLYIYFN